jgi:hypothetical protein
MKTTLLIFIMLCGVAYPQRLLVQFYTNDASGIPNGWPRTVSETDKTNIASGWHANYSVSEYLSYRSSMQAQHNAWVSNSALATSIVTSNNLARLMDLHSTIPTGRTITSNAAVTIATIEGSLASGTNSQAQVVTRIRQLNGVMENLRAIEANILEYLQRLGPVLKDLYRPENDETK